MMRKVLTVGMMGLLTVIFYTSPAQAKHRHAFEGGFQDELGRIGAHAAVNLGATVLGQVLNGSGLAYGAGGYPYGGRGFNHRAPAYYYRPPVRHHHHRHYRDRIIEKRVYVYEEYYPRYPRQGRRDYDEGNDEGNDCDYDD